MKFVILEESPNDSSNRMLRDTLTKLGVDPADVTWLTLTDKRNHTPSTEEVRAVLPELSRVLAYLTDKRWLLCVGAVAKQAITGSKEGVLKVQGQILNPRKDLAVVLADTTIMAVMSPAYVMRNSTSATQAQFLAVMGAFVAQGKGHSAETVRPYTQMRLYSTPERGALDIETTPVPWWHEGSKLISAAVSFDGRTAYTYDLRDPAQLVDFKRLVEGPTKWVMHNGKFDRQVLLSRGIDATLLFDTMSAQFLIDPDQRKGLQFLSGIYLGLPPYKDVDYENIEDEDINKVMAMNGKDAIRTWRLYEEVFRPRLEKDERVRRLFSFLLMPAINALLELELGGMPIDLDRLADLTDKYQDRWDREVEAFQHEAGWEVNPRSPQQMQKYFFKELGLPVLARTEKGAPSLDEAARRQLMGMHPAVERFDRIKTIGQRLGTFLRPWAELQRNGRLHTSYKPSHVVTGRLSSEKPNFQQVPRDPEFRRIFGGVPGHKVIELDYSQIELRLAAWIANEETMLEAYRNGEDLHTLTAERILGDPKARQVGKVLNFGLLYGAYPARLREIALNDYGVRLTIDEAERFHAMFFDSYPALRAWHRKVIYTAKAKQYFDSPIGRRRYFQHIGGSDRMKAGHDERAAINHGVQSLASDLMLTAVTMLHNNGFTVLATVHDSVLLLVDEDGAEFSALAAKDIMERDAVDWMKSKFGVDITVPIVVEYSIGTHWKE